MTDLIEQVIYEAFPISDDELRIVTETVSDKLNLGPLTEQIEILGKEALKDLRDSRAYDQELAQLNYEMNFQ